MGLEEKTEDELGWRKRERWNYADFWTFHRLIDEWPVLSLSQQMNHLVCCSCLLKQRLLLGLLMLLVINFLDEFIDGTKRQSPPKQNHFPLLLYFPTPGPTALPIIHFLRVFTSDISQKSKAAGEGTPNRVDWLRLPYFLRVFKVVGCFGSVGPLASTFEMTSNLVLRFSLKWVKQVRNIKNQALMANFLLRRRSSKLGG